MVVFFAHVNWGTVATFTLVPHIQLDKAYIALLIVVLGTTISPYLFFWQSAHRIEELREEPEGGSQPAPLKQRSTRAARLKLRTSRLDVTSGMAFSNVVMFAIMVATASTLGATGTTKIDSAAQAASGSSPSQGASPAPCSRSASSAPDSSPSPFSPVRPRPESWGSPDGNGASPATSVKRPRSTPWSRSARSAAPPSASSASIPSRCSVIVALINGLAAAPFLVVVMLIANDHNLMGKYANGHLATVVGWLTVALMTAAAVALIATS